MTVEFVAQEGAYNPERETVRFFALDDQISIMFVVSVEALWWPAPD